MIEIFVQSRYRVNRSLLRKRTTEFIRKLGIDTSLYTVSIAIIGDRKMRDIHERFARKKGTTPVLSFPITDGRPKIGSSIDRKYRERLNTVDGQHLLGEIIISYPQTLLFAADENKLVDVKLAEFVEHGLTKLLSG